jgi:hypothetical protein
MLACEHRWVKIKNGFCDTLKSKLQNIDEKRYHYMTVLGRAFGRPTLVRMFMKPGLLSILAPKRMSGTLKNRNFSNYIAV